MKNKWLGLQLYFGGQSLMSLELMLERSFLTQSAKLTNRSIREVERQVERQVEYNTICELYKNMYIGPNEGGSIKMM